MYMYTVYMLATIRQTAIDQRSLSDHTVGSGFFLESLRRGGRLIERHTLDLEVLQDYFEKLHVYIDHLIYVQHTNLKGGGGVEIPPLDPMYMYM